MEKYLNHIHYLSATVIEFGKNVDDGVWKGVGATVFRSSLQVGFTTLTTITIKTHGWDATILITENSLGETRHELVVGSGLSKALLDEAIIREDQLRTL